MDLELIIAIGLLVISEGLSLTTKVKPNGIIQLVQSILERKTPK